MSTDIDTFASKGCPGNLPGYGRPVCYEPKEGDEDFIGPLFPNALVNSVEHLQELTTLREFAMMQWMDQVCSKPDWHVKVNDPDITKKWKEETLALRSPNDFSESMVDYCVAELQDRAKAVLDPSNPPPVLVFDVGVYRSDTAISQDLKKEIQDLVVEFESRIPEERKDWHPNSDEKVWDLVHPSLFPLVYGTSRILPHGRTTTLDDCIDLCGSGEVIPEPTETELVETIMNPVSQWRSWKKFWSDAFQWLPCEVDIKGPKPKVMSYINNLHPVSGKKLYDVIERVLAAAVPLWELTLARLDRSSFRPELRISYGMPEWCDGQEMDNPESGPRLVFPEPGPYMARPVPKPLNFHDKYGQRGLQVIVKFANIQLTPEKPSYGGGTWHVEGQLNEHIVSTAIYYYSNENITQSKISFRQQVNAEKIVDVYNYDAQGPFCLSAYFGYQQDGPSVQEIGHVNTDEGRLLTFPNTLQHRVGPFELVDPTKPGHRKIIALFLVDPNIKIISTANIPCQQKEWWWDLVNAQLSKAMKATPHRPVGLDKLPAELKQVIYDKVDDFPLSLETAKEFREDLMDERSVLSKDQNEAFQVESRAWAFSLCEH